jgi:hypothetical protein
MSNMPTSLPNISNPTGASYLNSPAHSTQHSTANDEIAAIAAKVGIDSSSVTTSHDYKLSKVTSTNKAAPMPRTTTEASSATPTINTDNTDIHTITALATAITSMSSGLSGTPSNGHKLIVRILDNGTARAITWGASFASRGATLPTTTVAGKYQYDGFIWNSTTSTWDCLMSEDEL